MDFKQVVLGVVLSVSSAVSLAENSVTVEWAPFVKNAEVTDQQLIAAADRVNSAFLINQPGFIKRELIKKTESEYADVIHWKSRVHAEVAGTKVNSCVPCGNYFALMDMASGATAGAGFSHYSILKAWN